MRGRSRLLHLLAIATICPAWACSEELNRPTPRERVDAGFATSTPDTGTVDPDGGTDRPSLDAEIPSNTDAGPIDAAPIDAAPADAAPADAGQDLPDAAQPVPPTLEVSDGTYTNHDLFGDPTGSSGFEDICPAGNGLVGFDLNLGVNIYRIAGVCSEMELRVDDTVVPNALSILAGPTTTMPTQGRVPAGRRADIRCPPDAFVIGISGNADIGGVYSLTIHCARLLVSTTTQNEFVVSYGPVTTVEAQGDIVSGAPYTDILSSPAVIDRYRGQASIFVDAIGIGEATVKLTRR